MMARFTRDRRTAARRHRRWRSLAIALSVVIVVFAGATARLFVWPPQGMPAHVDAIVMLGGRGDRFGPAMRLAFAHRASTVVISTSTPIRAGSSGCAPPVPGVKVICFNPVPQTTQGEAEYAGRLAARYRWRSIALVTIAPQNARARLRLERCFRGKIYAVDAPFPARVWPYEIAYEWGASFKALFLQRSC
jgi:hypothetical protein